MEALHVDHLILIGLESFVHSLGDVQHVFVPLWWQTESFYVYVLVEFSDPDMGSLLDVDRVGDDHQLTQWC